MNKNADIIIEVRFKTPSEGGRKSSISGNVYSCPLLIDGAAFDCRILLGDKRIELGHTYDLEVRFLFRDLALPHLALGRAISLWEGKEIANGKIKAIVARC
jgi:hypothetical protein